MERSRPMGNLWRLGCSVAFVSLLAAALLGCEAPAEEAEVAVEEAEATSWLGQPLAPVPLAPEIARDREQKLAEAERAWSQNPNDADSWIWLGRRTAYLGRYREAIEIFTQGAARFPRDARFPRHRGHRFLTLRDTASALADLEHATALVAGQPDEIEPDGLPNASSIPTSTLQTNIAYHLGLAHYLRGDFESAAAAYRRCLALSTNPDMAIATQYWLFLSLQRAGKTAAAADLLRQAPVRLELLENEPYHRLLLGLRGDLDLESMFETAKQSGGTDLATIGYGFGAGRLIDGRKADAVRVFREVIAKGEWPAFGYLAAEAELARR